MKNLVIKSIILFVSILVFNSLAYGIGTLFHTPYQSTITVNQFNDYKNMTILLLIIIGISIPLIELLYKKIIKNNLHTSLIYLGLLVLITILSYDQLIFRPFEHGLTLICVGSIVFTRLLLNRKFN